MRKLINFFFKNSVFAVTKFGATETNDINKFRAKFDKASQNLAINFLLDKLFLNFINLSFQKKFRIPVGSEPALFKGNQHLYY